IASYASMTSPSHGGILDEFLIIQSTTSTRDSGLYDFLLPKLEAATGIEARVVAVGTGQAIRNTLDCNGDVMLVHSRADEEEVVREGYGVKRYDLMYNDFVIVGPKSDAAQLKQANGIKQALVKLSNSGEMFASRGDDSGTNKAELRLWEAAGVDVSPFSGQWYLETGSGMGKTLTLAIGKGAYTFTDRATWVKYANKQDHIILVEGDPPMFNQYGVMAISNEKCPFAKTKSAKKFVNWLISEEGQKQIGAYEVDGLQLFFPNAAKK
ncbi:MAG: substrate-binding domain-containing protein, partial [Nitratireductor sp.]